MSAASNSFDESFSHDQQIAQLRIPPHSIEAESSVLGGLLLDNSAWDRVGDLLNEGDFYRFEHRYSSAEMDQYQRRLFQFKYNQYQSRWRS